jgi:ABC-type dipeptide/oligopeptide/nickel transport system permease subunit
LGVALASSDEGLAVGEGGAVFRWNGLAWVPLESGVDVDLRAVALSEDGTGFVVGDKGTVLSYDGELLLSEPQATARSLHDVDIAEDGSAVAVGDRGTVLHMRNGEWTAYPAADTWSLRSVTFVDGNPARAVAVGEQSYVLRYEDDVWVEQQVAYRRNLTGVAAAGNLTVAVGTEPFIRQLEHPSWTFPAGTTQAGQDIMSQLIWGTRTALLVGLVTAIMVTLIGTNVGLIAGYYGGRIDNVLMRAVDVLYALPFEPLALILIAVFQPSLTLVILTIALVLWRTSARILRAQVLTLVQRPLVSSAKVAGASDLRILYQHIAPNVLPLAFLQLAVAIAAAITAEATLSFLGLGPSQVYSWGTILQQARISGAWRTAWWWTLPPGLLIMITVASVFFISRALEVFTNPRLLGAQRNA